jgi:hypothetical protein
MENNNKIITVPVVKEDKKIKILPLVTYTNIEDQKRTIIKDNKGRSGIYK